MCRLHFQAERLAISRKRFGSLILALATVFTRGQHHVVEVGLAIAIVKVLILRPPHFITLGHEVFPVPDGPA